MDEPALTAIKAEMETEARIFAEFHRKIAVGDEVVVFCRAHPLVHNSAASPAHPSRGRVLKIGRVWMEISSSGAPWRVRRDGSGRDTAALVGDAKAFWSEKFMRDRAYRSEAFVRQCVDEL